MVALPTHRARITRPRRRGSDLTSKLTLSARHLAGDGRDPQREPVALASLCPREVDPEEARQSRHAKVLMCPLFIEASR